MRILFVHQNFPGQYVHIAAALAAEPRNEVLALSMRDVSITGVRNVRYGVRRGSTAGIHHLATDFETKVLRGEAAAEAALQLRAEGFTPDVICGHPGWGETLFLKDVWPGARLLTFLEFAYSASGADVGFDPEFASRDEDQERFRIRSKNAGVYLALESSDWFVSPTRWQAHQFPTAYRNRISVIHDGIDTDLVKPNPQSFVNLGRGHVTLRPGDEVVTFVNRNLEPYRGYHSFMRALPEILRRRPKARAVIVGGSGVSYGATPPSGTTYREIFLEEVRGALDMSRVHFVGSIPYNTYLSLLQVSAAHIYLTYPFVLSWSLMESMAAGCAVVASATQPVEEVVRHQENGLLVDFLSPKEIAETTVQVLANPKTYRDMRAWARRDIVSRYDLKRVCLPQHLQLIQDIASGLTPACTGQSQ